MSKKASSEARALAPLSSVLDTENRFKIFNAFVVLIVLCYPLEWHMCGVCDCKKDFKKN